MDSNESLAVRITAVAAVARTGMGWSESLYERERYERILELAAEMAAIMAAGTDPITPSLADELKAGWLAQVTPGARGHATPKVSTGAMVFDAEGRILLGKRGDNGMWSFITGWQEVGLTPAQNVVKEVREETGIECRPVRLIGVRDTRLGSGSSNPTIHNIALAYLCEALSSTITLHPLETLDAGFFSEAEALKLVPERLRPLIQQTFGYWRGEITEPYFDPITE